MPNQSASAAFARLYDALTNGPGLYPLRGIVYFLSHPFLYPLLRAKLLPCALLSLFVLTNLFLFTYLPQVAFLAIWQGRSAWFNGTILVLGEGAAIVGLLFEAFFVDETQVDTFDSVLLSKGYEDLVSGNRPVDPDEEGRLDALRRLGKPVRKAQFAPFSFRQILEFVVFLPLNFVPFVGVPMFLTLTGYRAGPLLMWRYFALRGFTRKERNAYIKRRKWSYAWFGTVHLALQLIPVLNMFFLITTAAGSGLYAADEEARRLQEIDAQQREQPEGQYTDDPV